MKRNDARREVFPIAGGICAPEGYEANAVACGIRKEGLDFGMIYSPKRCSVACAYASGKTQGAPVKVSKKNMRSGYIRAIVCNGGLANAVQSGGEELALSVCDLFFPYGVERGEILLCSTGKMGEKLSLAPFQSGVRPLWLGLASSAEKSAVFATAISSREEEAKELAFSFDLGNYPCKIGVIFKGGRNLSPNMATFLAFLTTDVNISTPMLQRALNAALNETLNLLNLGGIPSPNDTVCIMANGRAGNYRIDYPDAEYKKFSRALGAVLVEICRECAKNYGKPFTCKVAGASSKEVSRSVAKLLVGAQAVKEGLRTGEFKGEEVFCLLTSVEYPLRLEKLQISLRSANGEVVLYEDERQFTFAKEGLTSLLLGENLELRVHFKDGNYQSTAFGIL